MGVYHFMGLGRAVGAVTCAVDYIEKSLDKISDRRCPEEIKKLFSGTGGIRHDEMDRGKIEALVLFTSPEVIGRRISAFTYEGEEKPGQVRDEVVKNLQKVWRRADEDKGRKVFWCEVDIDNFQDCFEKVVKATYRFSPPGRQGKEIWCNLTGGANVIGLALLSMARLTGKSTKNYMISQSKAYQTKVAVPREIQIRPNKDGYFNIVPFLKTNLDLLGFYKILTVLAEYYNGDEVETTELFNYLRGMEPFTLMDEKTFKRDYMLRLLSLGYTEYKEANDTVKISEAGWAFVIDELDQWDQVLNPGAVDFVAESKTWEWLTSETI